MSGNRRSNWVGNLIAVGLGLSIGLALMVLVVLWIRSRGWAHEDVLTDPLPPLASLTVVRTEYVAINPHDPQQRGKEQFHKKLHMELAHFQLRDRKGNCYGVYFWQPSYSKWPSLIPLSEEPFSIRLVSQRMDPATEHFIQATDAKMTWLTYQVITPKYPPSVREYEWSTAVYEEHCSK